MHHVVYPTKLIQINIVIGGKPPNPNLKSYFINQSALKYIGGGGKFYQKTSLFLTTPSKVMAGPLCVLINIKKGQIYFKGGGGQSRGPWMYDRIRE